MRESMKPPDEEVKGEKLFDERKNIKDKISSFGIDIFYGADDAGCLWK